MKIHDHQAVPLHEVHSIVLRCQFHERLAAGHPKCSNFSRATMLESLVLGIDSEVPSIQRAFQGRISALTAAISAKSHLIQVKSDIQWRGNFCLKIVSYLWTLIG
ncbi:MAG: hypothetical protein OEW16_12640 [Gammaproteobacteria bacterium]|nr:hypothetical protein [Gammaproteobacteria bacterium]